MKYALQLYGVFRTFETCLPNILQYILYDQLDYDVFILSQRADGYSPANEAKIRKMLGDKIITFKYIDRDYPDSVIKYEDRLCENYNECVKSARQTIQKDLVTNAFVTRLWHRRWLNNLMRVEYEEKNNVVYDWVIRTRFDIGYGITAHHKRLEFLKEPPKAGIVHMYPDIFSCGSPQAITYESNLINYWPYMYNIYRETGILNNDPGTIRKWLFMSEMNLIKYIEKSPFKISPLQPDLKITRQNNIQNLTYIDLKSEHLLKVSYGYDDKWVDITDKFVETVVNKYNARERKSTFVIDNAIAQCDPKPFTVKKIVISTLEGNEYIHQEHQTIDFKYQYLHQLNLNFKNIKSVSYGSCNVLKDITKRFMSLLSTNRKKIFFVSNKLAGLDPIPNIEKKISILLNDNSKYEFVEYSIVTIC